MNGNALEPETGLDREEVPLPRERTETGTTIERIVTDLAVLMTTEGAGGTMASVKKG